MELALRKDIGPACGINNIIAMYNMIRHFYLISVLLIISDL